VEVDNDTNAEHMPMETDEQNQMDMDSYYYNVPGTFGSDGTLPPGSYIWL